MVIVRGTDGRTTTLVGRVRNDVDQSRSVSVNIKSLEKMMEMVELGFSITNRLVLCSGNMISCDVFEKAITEMLKSKYPDVNIYEGDVRVTHRIDANEKNVVLNAEVYPFHKKELDCMLIEMKDNIISLTYVSTNGKNQNNRAAIVPAFEYKEPVLFVMRDQPREQKRRVYVNFKAGKNLTKEPRQLHVSDFTEHVAVTSLQLTDELLNQLQGKYNVVVDVLDIQEDLGSAWYPKFDKEKFFKENYFTNLIEDVEIAPAPAPVEEEVPVILKGSSVFSQIFN